MAPPRSNREFVEACLASGDAVRLAAVMNGLGEVHRHDGEMEQAERAYDLNKMAELKFGTLISLEREIFEEERRLKEEETQKRVLKEEVDEEDIAEVVAMWTGVPVMQIAARDRTRASLQGEILGATAMGVRNVLCVTGDSPVLAPQPRGRMDIPGVPLGTAGLGAVICAWAGVKDGCCRCCGPRRRRRGWRTRCSTGPPRSSRACRNGRS